MPNKEFISSRTEALEDLRRLIGDVLPGLLDDLPENHSQELDPAVSSAACSIIDAARMYSTAPAHFYGPAAEAAQTRQTKIREQQLAGLTAERSGKSVETH